MRLTPCCYSLVDSLWVWSTLVFLPDSRSTALKRTPIFRPVCFVCVRLYLFSLLFICGFTNSRSWQQQFDSSISKIQWFLFWWGRENLLRLCVFTLLCHHLGAHSFPSSAILTNHFWFIQALSFPFFFLPHVSQQQHSMFNISLSLSLSHSVGMLLLFYNFCRWSVCQSVGRSVHVYKLPLSIDCGRARALAWLMMTCYY